MLELTIRRRNPHESEGYEQGFSSIETTRLHIDKVLVWWYVDGTSCGDYEISLA